MFVVITVILVLLSYFGGEYILCCLRRDKIKIRILVNGTRGKSSVVRLISGALRKKGIPAMAKVSGTAPRIIYPDGREEGIVRRGHPNIIEQVRFIKEAARQKAEALVMEDMALIPQYQWISEHRMFRSTIGVITNIRADHLEIMGPTLKDVAEAISMTIPEKKVLVTSEDSMGDFLKEKAGAVGTEVKFVSGATVTDEMMRPLKYLEHRDNVACALEVCRELGIEKEKALEGMYEATPDPGVLRTFYVHAGSKKFEFINAFSANDPVSTFRIWRRVERKFVPEQTKIVLIHGRKERLDRSVQLGEFAVSDLPIDYLILTGEGTHHVERKVTDRGFDHSKVVNIPGVAPGKVYEKVLELIPACGVLFAIGSIGEGGMRITEYFEERKNG